MFPISITRGLAVGGLRTAPIKIHKASKYASSFVPPTLESIYPETRGVPVTSMRPIQSHEIHHARPPESALRLLADILPLPLLFLALWAGWPLFSGLPTPWWVGWGLVWFGGVAGLAWGVGASGVGRRG